MACEFSVGDKVIVDGEEGVVVAVNELGGSYVLEIKTDSGTSHTPCEEVSPA